VRIGVHVADLAVGNANSALAEMGAAISATTAPGGVRLSAPVFESVQGRLRLKYTDLARIIHEESVPAIEEGPCCGKNVLLNASPPTKAFL